MGPISWCILPVCVVFITIVTTNGNAIEKSSIKENKSQVSNICSGQVCDDNHLLTHASKLFPNIPEQLKAINDDIIKESYFKESVICWTRTITVETDSDGNEINKYSAYEISFGLPKNIKQNYVYEKHLDENGDLKSEYPPVVEIINTDSFTTKKTKYVTCTQRIINPSTEQTTIETDIVHRQNKDSPKIFSSQFPVIERKIFDNNEQSSEEDKSRKPKLSQKNIPFDDLEINKLIFDILDDSEETTPLPTKTTKEQNKTKPKLPLDRQTTLEISQQELMEQASTEDDLSFITAIDDFCDDNIDLDILDKLEDSTVDTIPEEQITPSTSNVVQTTTEKKEIFNLVTPQTTSISNEETSDYDEDNVWTKNINNMPADNSFQRNSALPRKDNVPTENYNEVHSLINIILKESATTTDSSAATLTTGVKFTTNPYREINKLLNDILSEPEYKITTTKPKDIESNLSEKSHGIYPEIIKKTDENPSYSKGITKDILKVDDYYGTTCNPGDIRCILTTFMSTSSPTITLQKQFTEPIVERHEATSKTYSQVSNSNTDFSKETPTTNINYYKTTKIPYQTSYSSIIEDDYKKNIPESTEECVDIYCVLRKLKDGNLMTSTTTLFQDMATKFPDFTNTINNIITRKQLDTSDLKDETTKELQSKCDPTDIACLLKIIINDTSDQVESRENEYLDSEGSLENSESEYYYSSEESNVEMFPIVIKKLGRFNKNKETNFECWLIDNSIKYGTCPNENMPILILTESLLPKKVNSKHVQLKTYNIKSNEIIIRGKKYCYVFNKQKQFNCPVNLEYMLTILKMDDLSENPDDESYFNVELLKKESPTSVCIEVDKNVLIIDCPIKKELLPVITIDELPENVRYAHASEDQIISSNDIVVSSNSHCLLIKTLRNVKCSKGKSFLTIKLELNLGPDECVEKFSPNSFGKYITPTVRLDNVDEDDKSFDLTKENTPIIANNIEYTTQIYSNLFTTKPENVKKNMYIPDSTTYKDITNHDNKDIVAKSGPIFEIEPTGRTTRTLQEINNEILPITEQRTTSVEQITSSFAVESITNTPELINADTLTTLSPILTTYGKNPKIIKPINKVTNLPARKSTNNCENEDTACILNQLNDIPISENTPYTSTTSQETSTIKETANSCPPGDSICLRKQLNYEYIQNLSSEITTVSTKLDESCSPDDINCSYKNSDLNVKLKILCNSIINVTCMTVSRNITKIKNPNKIVERFIVDSLLPADLIITYNEIQDFKNYAEKENEIIVTNILETYILFKTAIIECPEDTSNYLTINSISKNDCPIIPSTKTDTTKIPTKSYFGVEVQTICQNTKVINCIYVSNNIIKINNTQKTVNRFFNENLLPENVNIVLTDITDPADGEIEMLVTSVPYTFIFYKIATIECPNDRSEFVPIISDNKNDCFSQESTTKVQSLATCQIEDVECLEKSLSEVETNFQMKSTTQMIPVTTISIGTEINTKLPVELEMICAGDDFECIARKRKEKFEKFNIALPTTPTTMSKPKLPLTSITQVTNNDEYYSTEEISTLQSLFESKESVTFTPMMTPERNTPSENIFNIFEQNQSPLPSEINMRHILYPEFSTEKITTQNVMAFSDGALVTPETHTINNVANYSYNCDAKDSKCLSKQMEHSAFTSTEELAASTETNSLHSTASSDRSDYSNAVSIESSGSTTQTTSIMEEFISFFGVEVICKDKMEKNLCMFVSKYIIKLPDIKDLSNKLTIDINLLPKDARIINYETLGKIDEKDNLIVSSLSEKYALHKVNTIDCPKNKHSFLPIISTDEECNLVPNTKPQSATRTETDEPLKIKYVKGKRTHCFSFDNNVRLHKIKCPEDTSKLPTLSRPEDLRTLCRTRLKNKNQRDRTDLLRRLNIITD